MPRFYITTPIYYVNDVPHVGHAYTTIAADALARFHRAIGDDTRLLTGTDDHGLKVEQAASARGLQPNQLADQVVQRFRSTWTHLDISNDDFIRTTEERHKLIAQELWRRMAARGDIYKGKYEGWYCVSCEGYYPEAELAPGKLCPVHKREVTWLSETTYFFKMSRYQEPLLEHFERHPTFVQPEGYKNEVVSFIKSGLRDLSASRTTFRWGIPVPGDEEHIIYVWVDALINYLSALGPIGGELHRRFWPPTCHLIGKDILRFHAVYWPCMLLSAGLPLPETIFAHGWWTVRGEKISKSMPATRVDPNQLAEDIGVDALRYYLLREVPLGLDGDFAYENLIGRYNAELAHDLGNLVSRALTVAGKFTGGKVPAGAGPAAAAHAREIAQVAAKVIGEAAEQYRAFAPSRALESIWRLVRESNRYINDMQPWVIARDPARRGELEHVVRTALEAIACSARLLAPVIPKSAAQIVELVGGGRDLAATWPAPERFGQELAVGSQVGESVILFPRIDEARQAALLDRWIPEDARAARPEAEAAPKPPAGAKKPAARDAARPAGQGAARSAVHGAAGNGPRNAGQEAGRSAGKSAEITAEVTAEVTVDEFGRLDLRVAEVVQADAIPGASKLLRLLLDAGEPEPRQVVAGIAEAYRPEDLVGRKVIFLANLKPATIRGVSSQGMILAAGEKNVVGLSALDRDVPVGTKIR